MPGEPRDTFTFTLAQVVGMVVMTLASVYWVAVDYPDWLPASFLTAMPEPPLGTVTNWIIIFAGSGLGWALYQWGTLRKSRLAEASRGRH